MDKIEKASHYMSIVPGLQQVTGIVEIISAMFLVVRVVSLVGFEAGLVSLKLKQQTQMDDNVEQNLVKYAKLFFRGISHMAPFYGTYYSIKCLKK